MDSALSLTPRPLARVHRDQIIARCCDGTWDRDPTYCYDPDKAARLLGDRESVDALDILRAGLRGDLPAKDAHYAAMRPDFLPDTLMRWLACDYAQREVDAAAAVGQTVDRRSTEAIRVARLHACGMAGDDELAAARSAARSAVLAAAWAAWSAAWSAALVAESAARSVAESAARATARAAAWATEAAAEWAAWSAEWSAAEWVAGSAARAAELAAAWHEILTHTIATIERWQRGEDVISMEAIK